MLSVFFMVSTPVLANILYGEKKILSNNVLKEVKVDQKELLFQTILDIVNNKEIQRVILNSEIKRGWFFNPNTRISVFNPYVLTRTELNTAYHVGLMLSKNFDVSRIRSMFERYRGSNQALQKEITAVIEKDATIKGELTQLSDSKCNCRNNSGVTVWHFPVICTILAIMLFFLTFIVLYLHVGYYIFTIIGILFSEIFKCNGI